MLREGTMSVAKRFRKIGGGILLAAGVVLSQAVENKEACRIHAAGGKGRGKAPTEN
jgi:hypothetical protein